MKRAAAILLSLMFFWLQAMASAQTSFGLAKTVRECCGCQQRDCCVTPAAPDSQSLPATVVPAKSQSNLSVLISPLVAWMLPATASAQLSASASALLPAPAVPLFSRHCARLI